MSQIIVAGAGHGGLVAAIKLAAAGHEVTVYDKQKKGGYYLDQRDSFEAGSMEYAGIEIPEHYRAKSNSLTFVPVGDETPALTLPAKEGSETLTVERKELHEYLINLAENTGAQFVYETQIESPVVLGSRIAGIRTDKGTFYADLVIDACGMNSPVRSNLPVFAMIEKSPAHFDVLHTYRAYFENIKGAQKPETDYNLYLYNDGTEGLMWLVTDEEYTDALIARFNETSYSELAPCLHTLSIKNPQMGTKLLRGGYFVDIPVRQPLAVLVADGYAAVGDSAFMTYSLKGSGIAYSIRAGAMLANAVLADEIGLYTAETLWEYEKQFFKEIGFGACRIAIAKNFLPYVTADEVDRMFATGLISEEELEAFSEGRLETVIKGKFFSTLKSKLQILGEMPELRSKLLTIVSNIGRFAAVEPSFPNRYERGDVEKWAEKYNGFFDSIRRSETEEINTLNN